MNAGRRFEKNASKSVISRSAPQNVVMHFKEVKTSLDI